MSKNLRKIVRYAYMHDPIEKIDHSKELQIRQTGIKMPTKNDITGDAIKSKSSNENYRNNYDRIFNKKWNHTCDMLGKAIEIPKNGICPICGLSGSRAE